MCKKEVLSLPAGDTHSLITRFVVYSAPQHTAPLHQRGQSETTYYAFRQGGKGDLIKSGQMNELYTLEYALLLDPMMPLKAQFEAVGVMPSISEIRRLTDYMQVVASLDDRYKARQWFHILKEYCGLPHKPRPAVKNNERPMYFPLETLRSQRRPAPCSCTA